MPPVPHGEGILSLPDQGPSSWNDADAGRSERDEEAKGTADGAALTMRKSLQKTAHASLLIEPPRDAIKKFVIESGHRPNDPVHR